VTQRLPTALVTAALATATQAVTAPPPLELTPAAQLLAARKQQKQLVLVLLVLLATVMAMTVVLMVRGCAIVFTRRARALRHRHATGGCS
jgi:hypothetical protein